MSQLSKLIRRLAKRRRRPESHSQIGQDLWVLEETRRKHHGFFVEIGAFDGVRLSNSYLLERSFGWKGLLVEPNPRFHQSIRELRRAPLSTKCVWSRSGAMLQFRICQNPELSTIDQFSTLDSHDRSAFELIQVETISLDDLLKEYNAPRTIDYISIDVEGSELEILSAFDFSAFDVRLLTIEHANATQESAIDKLLDANGYARVAKWRSQWDGWYRKRERPHRTLGGWLAAKAG